MCAMCGKDVPCGFLQLAVSAPSFDGAYQVWWVHPKCAYGMLHPDARFSLHPQLADVMGVPHTDNETDVE